MSPLQRILGSATPGRCSAYGVAAFAHWSWTEEYARPEATEAALPDTPTDCACQPHIDAEWTDCVAAPDNSKTRAINAEPRNTTGAFFKRNALSVNHAQGIARSTSERPPNDLRRCRVICRMLEPPQSSSHVPANSRFAVTTGREAAGSTNA